MVSRHRQPVEGVETELVHQLLAGGLLDTQDLHVKVNFRQSLLRAVALHLLDLLFVLLGGGELVLGLEALKGEEYQQDDAGKDKEQTLQAATAFLKR